MKNTAILLWSITGIFCFASYYSGRVAVLSSDESTTFFLILSSFLGGISLCATFVYLMKGKKINIQKRTWTWKYLQIGNRKIKKA